MVKHRQTKCIQDEVKKAIAFQLLSTNYKKIENCLSNPKQFALDWSSSPKLQRFKYNVGSQTCDFYLLCFYFPWSGRNGV